MLKYNKKRNNILKNLKFRHLSVFLFLSIIIIGTYSNTFHASFHLDDRPNIVNNYFLHINSLYPDQLFKTFYTDIYNPYELKNTMYRPVPCLTFALNWYFGKYKIFGYHVVNTFIHILTSFFLFLFITNLLTTPNLENLGQKNHLTIALLASLLWALNPMQTQAVTYIVQRMAQMAAMFYIISMYAYLKGRLDESFIKKIAWFLFCFIAFILGIYSKANAAMLPIAILLIEIIFFQNLKDKKTCEKIFLISLITVVTVFLFGTKLFLNGNPGSIFNYGGRLFTPAERLLAQPRIVVFYLSQIFYPLFDRFSIAHDIILSSSFLKPWTTIPSLAIIFFLIGYALSIIKKIPLLSFAILFFFLNHIIESSIIPLELIFEHRNYLPSLFLFLPVAYLLCYNLQHYKKKNRLVYFLTIFFIFFIIIFFSMNTFLRNKAWENDVTLWTDAVVKAPNNARASNNLAITLAWGNNNHPKKYDLALKLLKDSLDKSISRQLIKADIIENMALIHFYKKNNYKEGIELFKKALEINPDKLKIRRDFTNALIILKDFKAAEKQADLLLEKNSKNGIYHNLKGHILLWQGHYGRSLESFRKAWELSSNKKSILLDSSVALSLDRHYKRADVILNEAVKHYPEFLAYYFVLIENSIRAGEKEKIILYTKKMLGQFKKEEIIKGIELYTDNPKFAPISKKIIAPVIENMF